jgi:hypothetical protein
MNDLKALMELVATTWECDVKRYPELQGKALDERRNFLVKHSLMHIAKTSGKLASVCEEFDHNGGYEPDSEEMLKGYATKLFVNALKLAEEVGLSADDLLQRAPKFIT